MHYILNLLFLLVALREKRTAVVSELKKLQLETEPIIKIFESEENQESIANARYVYIVTINNKVVVSHNNN